MWERLCVFPWECLCTQPSKPQQSAHTAQNDLFAAQGNEWHFVGSGWKLGLRPAINNSLNITEQLLFHCHFFYLRDTSILFKTILHSREYLGGNFLCRKQSFLCSKSKLFCFMFHLSVRISSAPCLSLLLLSLFRVFGCYESPLSHTHAQGCRAPNPTIILLHYSTGVISFQSRALEALDFSSIFTAALHGPAALGSLFAPLS